MHGPGTAYNGMPFRVWSGPAGLGCTAPGTAYKGMSFRVWHGPAGLGCTAPGTAYKGTPFRVWSGPAITAQDQDPLRELTLDINTLRPTTYAYRRRGRLRDPWYYTALSNFWRDVIQWRDPDTARVALDLNRPPHVILNNTYASFWLQDSYKAENASFGAGD